MTSPEITVVLCAHNPRASSLRRVLHALATQSLPVDRWELLLVDNASTPALSERNEFDDLLAMLPVRVLVEPKLGLTPARMSGFAEVRSPLLVLIDDDTVPAPDYLQVSLRLINDSPHVGAAGGRISGDFERPPPLWANEALGCLALRDFGERPIRALIYNTAGPWEPCGAGMLLRREVACAYAKAARSNVRLGLDRVGASLSSCGDTDLARTAADLGMYLAYEPEMCLTHLIPAGRLKLIYLVRLIYAIQRDATLLQRVRGDRSRMSIVGYCLRILHAAFSTIAADPRRWLLRLAARLGQLQGRRLPIEADHG